MECIKGNGGAPGMGRGNALVLGAPEAAGTSVIRTLEEAKKECLEKMDRLYEKALESLGEEEAKIFKAYAMLLSDKTLYKGIDKRIENGLEPVAAVFEETRHIAGTFQAMKQEYMRQRGEDILHIGDMLINSMKGLGEGPVLPEGDFKVVLVARELSPADTLQMDKTRLSAIVTELGGATSHTVILAKAMGIPAVTGVKDVFRAVANGMDLLVNGTTGEILLSPDENALENYRRMAEADALLNRKISEANYQYAETLDGVRIKIYVNIGSAEDLSSLEGESYDGVGLFRTEFLYSGRTQAPSPEEEKKAYEEVLVRVSPRETTIRTLDIGGDKAIPYLDLPKEENPFCGNRGVRLCLDRRELFEQQLKAILIAGAGKAIRIMFPMITEIAEFEACKAIVEKVRQELTLQSISACDNYQLGIMVETPAAALMADSFARKCDFLSIGTNDLTQYVTATDRGNPKVQALCNAYNPAVLRLIHQTIKAGKERGKEVSVCGELASDPVYMPLLVGFGLKKLSVSPPLVKKLRYKLCQVRFDDLQRFAAEMLELDDAREIYEKASQRSLL